MRILFWVIPSVKFQSGKTNCSDFHYLSLLNIIKRFYPNKWFSNDCFSKWEGITVNLETNNIINLSISNIEIENLNESFGNLIYLTKLNIINNILYNLSDSFGNLTSLTQLSITYTNLQRLPESFGNLSSLTDLDISYNELQILPNSFGKLSSLTSLNLTNNELQSLPNSFGKLSSLISLNLTNNNIHRLLKSFNNLSLIQLFISKNILQIIQKSFINILSLPQLYIYISHYDLHNYSINHYNSFLFTYKREYYLPYNKYILYIYIK